MVHTPVRTSIRHLLRFALESLYFFMYGIQEHLHPPLWDKRNGPTRWEGHQLFDYPEDVGVISRALLGALKVRCKNQATERDRGARGIHDEDVTEPQRWGSQGVQLHCCRLPIQKNGLRRARCSEYCDFHHVANATNCFDELMIVKDPGSILNPKLFGESWKSFL